MTAREETYVCITYKSGEPNCERLLEKYLATTDVENNKTKKNLRMDCYDGTKGALFLLVNSRFDRVDGMSSCILYEEAGVRSAKVWHRLHLLPTAPASSMDRFFEPATFKWCEENNIPNLWVTFNCSSPRTFEWAAAKMGERRNSKRINLYTNGYGHHIRSSWRPHNKLILERFVWQYVIYHSPDTTFFLDRQERELDMESLKICSREFPHVVRDWT